MAGFGDFQIFRPDLLGVVATGWARDDKGSPKAKRLSCGIAGIVYFLYDTYNEKHSQKI